MSEPHFPIFFTLIFLKRIWYNLARCYQLSRKVYFPNKIPKSIPWWNKNWLELREKSHPLLYSSKWFFKYYWCTKREIVKNWKIVWHHCDHILLDITLNTRDYISVSMTKIDTNLWNKTWINAIFKTFFRKGHNKDKSHI